LNILQQPHTQDVKGNCTITASAALSAFPQKFTSNCALSDGYYRTIGLPNIQASLRYANQIISGPAKLTFPRNVIIEATGTFDIQKKSGVFTVQNTTPLLFPYQLKIPTKKLNLTMTLHADKAISGEYTAQYIQKKDTLKSSEHELKGIVHWTDQHLIIQGNSDIFHYDFLAAAKPYWHLEYCDCHLDKEQVIHLKAENNDIFHGKIGYHLLRLLLHSTGWHVPGEGILHVRGSLNTDRLKLAMNMKEGNIRLPYTYNLLQDFQGNFQYSFNSRSFSIDHARIKLHKGHIAASHIIGSLDQEYRIQHIRAPLLLHNCFFSRKKDFFALFSGAFNITYTTPAQLHITGFALLDRSHIQSNILSEEFQKEIFGGTTSPCNQPSTNINFNINLLTKSPLQVKTSFLDASAHVNITMKGSMNEPAMSGNIDIIQGSFQFPYKPLFIKRGKIYFLPQQLYDPIIEVVAENTLRKYTIRMNLDGSAKNRKIVFTANPPLLEEQIIGLLLGGTEDGSLSLAMPHSVMNTLEDLLFGPAHTRSKVQRTLQNLLNPFKSIRIVPSFSDQTGRGGQRGSLAIEVNDRLRANIEQNFSLPEDTKIEVEYALSDDMRIRGVKDERGDLGGEFEGRWKF